MTLVRPTRLAALCLLTVACGKNPGAYQTSTATTAKEAVDAPSLVAQADEAWEARLDEAEVRKALDLYAKVIAADPKNRHALLHLTRGWYFLGDSHLTDKDAKIEAWATAITYGKQCLALNETFASRVATEKEKDAAESLTKDDAPCAYWTASALGKWGKIQGVAKVLGQLPTVKAYITAVESLDPQYFHYGPARYWGAYYSASSFTWDEEKSREYFAASIEGAPYYLATYGLRAEQLAVKTKDFDLFASDIQTVLNADASAEPSLVPENTLEQRKAKALWDSRSDLFFADAIAAWEATHGTAQ